MWFVLVDFNTHVSSKLPFPHAQTEAHKWLVLGPTEAHSQVGRSRAAPGLNFSFISTDNSICCDVCLRLLSNKGTATVIVKISDMGHALYTKSLTICCACIQHHLKFKTSSHMQGLEMSVSISDFILLALSKIGDQHGTL